MVLAEGHGTVTDRDVFGYQQEAWSRPEVAGLAELVDMTEVEHIGSVPRRFRQSGDLC